MINIICFFNIKNKLKNDRIQNADFRKSDQKTQIAE